MLKLALVFFLVSLVAGVLGFSGASGATRRGARVLFVVALGVFIGSIALALSTGSLDL